MKYFKIFLLGMALSAAALTLSSCGNKGDANNAETTEQQGKEHTSAYVCPMHCEGSGSEEAGQCPVCGMDYVKNEEHKADGHTHQH